MDEETMLGVMLALSVITTVFVLMIAVRLL